MEWEVRYSIDSRMCSGPVEQLSPITFTPNPSKIATTAVMSVPSSILPFTSRVTCAWIGSQRCSSSKASRMPLMAALTSRISFEVSMSSRSTPPRIRPTACSRKTSLSSSKLISDISGSLVEISLPEGPIEPATKRGFSRLKNSSAAWRAILAAFWFSSITRSCKP